MSKEIEKNDPLIVAMMDVYKKKRQAKINTLSGFESIEEMLIHLANSSPKEREKFLKPWKDSSAKSGIGRRKNDDFNFFVEMHKERHSLETKNGKKFRSWKMFLQSYFKEEYPKMPTEEADRKIKTAENRITGYESKTKKIFSQIKSS